LSTVQADFLYEYEVELDLLSRRRFSVWAVTGIVFWSLCFILAAIWVIAPRFNDTSPLVIVGTGLALWLWIIKAAVGGSILAAGLYLANRQALGHEHILRSVFWILAATTVMVVGVDLLLQRDHDPNRAFLIIVGGHLIACVLLPWSTMQAVRCGVVVWLIWLIGMALLPTPEDQGMGGGLTLSVIIGGAILLLPGLVICSSRTTALGKRFERRMLERSYESFSQDMFDAQRIHEALFPRPVLDGPVQFTFRDRPRVGIGGDLLHAHSPDKNGSITLTVLDVGGDGIAAALTVNRLHGELERLFAERPDMKPDETITALDRYTRLTLAPLDIYAVAMCIHLEPDGSICWAGAGHMPAVVRRSDGSMDRLESTTWHLGASEESDPMHSLQHQRLQPDDHLTIYTDGACEYPDADGQPMGFRGVERLIRQFAETEPLHERTVRFLERLDSAFDVNQLDDPTSFERVAEDVLVVVARIP